MPPFLRLTPLFSVLLLASCATVEPLRAPVPATAPSPPPMARPAPPFQAPIPEASDEAVKEVPSGSLWAQGGGSLYRDIKANRIGDILTITVSEEAKGAKEAATNTTRNKQFEGSFKFAGAGMGPTASAPVGAATFGPYMGQFKNGFNGSGSTSRTDSMSAYMTATVVDVLPTGNLFIRGSRWTKVNDEMQQIVLEGIVRPTDITRNNTVLSQNIAEAKIFLVGKGPVTKQQKPGWLGQVLDFVMPF